MCLYGPPRAFGSADRITYPAAGDERDELDAGETVPDDAPQRDVVAPHMATPA
jgi:hypothetical protein